MLDLRRKRNGAMPSARQFYGPNNKIKMHIYCTGCGREVEARLTNGAEMYPHRTDLASMPFWIHDECGAFVGTHHKTKHKLKPLGFLATPEVKKWRKIIHDILDPLWRNKKIKRTKAYAYISNRIGHTYHTGEIYSVEEGKQIYEIVLELKMRIDPSPFNR